MRAAIAHMIYMLILGLALLGDVTVLGLVVAHVYTHHTVVGVATMSAAGVREQTYIDTLTADTQWPVSTWVERSAEVTAGAQICALYVDGAPLPTIELRMRHAHPTLSAPQAHVLVSDAVDTLCPTTT